MTLLAPTIDGARSVIVSSDSAASTVRAMAADGPPILVLPLAFPPVGDPPSVPPTREIVAVGWLAANKAPMLAFELLSRLGAATTPR